MKHSYFFLLFLILARWGYGQDIQQILSHIPEDDKKVICSLFHHLVRDQFAYTLFADKPVSISGHFTMTPMNNILCGRRCGGLFWKEWKVWNKYKNNFKLNKYILIDEPSEIHQDISFVILINKKAFIKTVKKYHHLFDKILGQYIQAENLLRDIELKQVSFQSAIKNNELLWGILLGYGKHNATLYAKRERFLNLKDLKKKSVLPLSIPKMDKIEEKIEFLNQHLQPFGDPCYLPLISDSVYFVADSEHPETKALEKKYRKMRAKISSIYAQEDFLEINLTQLTSKD